MNLLQDQMNNTMVAAGAGAIAGAFMVVILIVAVLCLICEWIVYTKAGKPGWAVLIPIYNIIVLLEIVGKPWWWLFLLLIPIVNIVIIIMVINLLAKSFGQGVGFTLGLIFLSPIFYAVLALSKNIKYVGPGGVAPNPAPTPAS